MTEFNKNMTNEEFLQELHQLDTTELIKVFNEIKEGYYKIYDASDLVEALSDDEGIRDLLEIQRDLPHKNLWDYNYIVTGGYSFATDASNDIFELFNRVVNKGWLDFKDELIEYFTREDL